MTKKGYKLTVIISISMVLAIVLLSSYAFWRVREVQSGSNQIVGACLSISFEEELDANNNPIPGITMEKAWPISDEEGIATKGYTFTVVNKCDKPVNYELVLETMKIPEPGNKMPDNYVKVRLDDRNIKRASDFEEVENDSKATYANDIDKTYKIYTGTVSKENPETHIIRQWYSMDAPEETVGYDFESKVKIYAGQGITQMDEDEICYLILPDGTLTHYNSKCGKDVTLPESYNGLPIKKIATNAFRYDNPKKPAYFLNSGYTKDDIDFTIAVSKNYVEDYPEYVAAHTDVWTDVLLNIDDNDIWMVNYKNIDNLNNIVLNMLDNEYLNGGGILNAEDLSYIFAARDSLADQGTDIHNECNASDPSCDLGNVAWAFKIGENEGEYEFLGYYGIPEDLNNIYLMEINPLTIDTIDFSQSTNLTEIAERAFENYNADSLSFPNSLKIIGDYAFSDYGGSVLTLPDSLEYIGIFAFSSYYGDNLVLPSSLETISSGSFYWYNGNSLEIPSSIKEIGDGAFYSYAGADSELIIPDNVEIIGPNAFRSYRGTSLSLGTGVKEIGERAFYSYKGDNLALPSSLETIGHQAFYWYNGNSPAISSSVKEIGREAFYNYVGADNELIIPDSVEIIDYQAFYKYNGTGLSLGTGVKEIGYKAFYNYNSNNELILPSNLEEIKDGAFAAYVGSGTELIIPNSVTYLGAGAFQRFNGDSLTIGTGLTSIGGGAFASYNGDELTLPNGIETIGDSAFYSYNGDSLIIPNSVTEIGDSAFMRFNKGTLVLGNNIKTIGGHAFATYYGKNTTLSLPNGLENIGIYAFYCFSGNNVIIPASIKKIDSDAFASGYSHIQAYNYSTGNWNDMYRGTGIPQITIKMSEEDFAQVEKGDRWYYQSTLVYDPD